MYNKNTPALAQLEEQSTVEVNSYRRVVGSNPTCWNYIRIKIVYFNSFRNYIT